MTQITINEVSQNYTYNIGSNSFCTVALPITACWGPGYVDPSILDSLNGSSDDMLDKVVWTEFPATQAGLESFVSTYRGPSSNYRSAHDYSYQMAMTLLTAGYNVLVCRVCPGSYAAHLAATGGFLEGVIVSAKYPGSFGNALSVKIDKVPNRKYYRAVVNVKDANGKLTAVENLVFTLNEQDSSEEVPHLMELESNFIQMYINTSATEDAISSALVGNHELSGGEDYYSVAEDDIEDPDNSIDARITRLITDRFTEARYTSENYTVPEDVKKQIEDECVVPYKELMQPFKKTDLTYATNMLYKQFLYTAAVTTYKKLTDKLSYSPQRVISPGWDDLDLDELQGKYASKLSKEEIVLSPIHIALMNTAYYSRCATALLDIPRSLNRSDVYYESTQEETMGYAQKLSNYSQNFEINQDGLYSTHSALFAPWGRYKYVGTSKLTVASPAFQALLIQRAMLLNQSIQYEWMLPSTRKHNVALGKLDYTVPKHMLDEWQKSEGVGVNVIATIPDLGTILWGNSTLFDVPPATYQALANLSTRYLVNAVENVAYRVGLTITFNYNNDEAYSKFYAGVTPILDTMKNVGAIDGYYVKMSADINGLDQVNANTVIGKIYLVINGVINDINIDLIALPPGTDLAQFQS